MQNLPISISALFVLTTFLIIFLYYKATNYSKVSLIILLLWLTFQTFIGLSGFYITTNGFPPRFLLLIFPPLALIIILFMTSNGRSYVNRLDLKMLTLLHVIRIPVELVLFRIPVELVLFFLYQYRVIPELMTFEGRNVDILSGLTAPFIYYFGFIKERLNTKVVLLWNLIRLGLLLNIVVNAVLSAPFTFQKFAFDQPNIAVLYFPFNWLPCCVVPLVLFSHLVVIRNLLLVGKKNK